MKIQSVFLFIFLISNHLYATTYYVDASNGNDNNNGTSTSTAWKSLAKVISESSSFLPGDIILLKKNEIWNGEYLYSLTHPSGTADNPITYSSYGEGEKPIINVIVNQTPNWTNEGNNIWSTPTADYRRFFKNGIEMLRAVEEFYLGLYGTEYYTNEGKLYIYSATNPSLDTFSWAMSPTAIGFEGSDYINIEGLDLRGSSLYALKLYNNIEWTIENCNIGYNASYGCRLKYSSNITIRNCNFDSNLTVNQSLLPPDISGSSETGCSDGIFVSTGSSYITVENCYFKNWGHASFSANTDDPLNKISHIVFRNNELTSPDLLYGGRIAYSGYSDDGEYYNNYIHNISVANQLGGSRNHFHHNIIDGVLDSPLKSDKIGIGIWLQNYNVQILDNIIENNLIANTESKGYEIYSINWDYPNEVSGNIFRNNILYNCGTQENNIAIQFHKDQSGQLIYNNLVQNNLIFNDNSTQTFSHQFNGTICNASTFNTLDQDISNNISENPLLVDISNSDFHLTENSPCIDAGSVTLSTLDYEGNSIFNGIAPDIGIYEYQSNLSTNNISESIIKLFPNPTLNNLIISTNKPINGQINVINEIGSVLLEKTFKNQNEISISLENFSVGMYFIKLQFNGNIQTFKVIKL